MNDLNPEENYIAINKHSWNNRTDTHLKSDFYNLAGFLKGETSLNSIELALLGDISGKKYYTYNVISDRIQFL